MKIATFGLENWQKEKLEKIFGEKNITSFKSSIKQSHLKKIENVDVLIIFIYSQIDKKIIEKLPKLKLICTMSTGYDHIDIECAKERKIKVCNVPIYGENTVAEHTLALILALSRKIYPSIERTHENLNFETDKSLRGFDLKDKILGVVGGGNIGQHVVKMAKALEMNVLVFDLNKDKKLEKKFGFKYVTMANLLKQSDIITLHVPYNTHTHHLINKNAIDKMKDGVYLINTARGGIIDTNALIKGLKSKKVAGAGLDVLEGECDILEESSVLSDEFKKSCVLKIILQDHMLMKMDNVIVTPHNAFNSNEALSRILETTIENIKAYKISKLKNVVNR